MCRIHEDNRLPTPAGFTTTNENIFLNGEINENNVAPRINTPLREVYRLLLQARISGEGVREWTVRVRSMSMQINIEFRVLAMLMHEYHYDRSIPEDTSILVYGLRRIQAIDSERIRENMGVDWTLNALTILSYLDFDFDTARFILQRIRNLA
ncbi:hypothetical protein ACI65C_008326 [Semiaphis heraclei]